MPTSFEIRIYDCPARKTMRRVALLLLVLLATAGGLKSAASVAAQEVRQIVETFLFLTPALSTLVVVLTEDTITFLRRHSLEAA